jgi:16S rRNA (cytosine967-C5)-methyltransferase
MFDRILLDAPCSATGVIRRNPDIKLHRNAADIQNLSALQLDILTALWATLKPGGLLLYATCSVLPDENENVVARFCQQQIDAEHQTITANWGLARDYGRQLFPQPHGPDGFFYALLAKKL